jgi:tetratricopeptide (TPR) repeat protein
MELDASDLKQLLARLRQAGQHPDQGLLDQIKALGPAAAGPLVEIATDEKLHYADQESPEVWAPLHAVRLLGELEAAEAVEPLLPLFGMDDDWLAEALPEAFGRIGRPALQPLRELLFDRTQDEIWAAGRAATGLRKIAEHHPELRADAVAALVDRLDPKETRVPDDETLNAYVIVELGDLGATEAAPAIRRAFDEDRVDTSVTRPEDTEADLGVPIGSFDVGPPEPGGMRLRLRCTACGYERPHDVGRVYYDLGTPDRHERDEESRYEPWVITRRITCPKCGAVDQYELGSQAQLALTAELLKLHPEIGKLAPAGESDAPALAVMRFGLKDGRQMHPYAARDTLRREVAAEPFRPDLRLGYANVLRFLNYREEAVSEYRAAIDLDPANVEAYLNLAILVREDGDLDEARQLFERVVELAPRSRLPGGQRRNYVDYAREALAELKGDRPPRDPSASPFVLEPMEAPIRPAVTHAPARSGPKVGRNTPCPCGSGRKYKKCCGR